MYHDRRARPSARSGGVRVARSACPSAGPAIVVNDAIRPSSRGEVANSQPWTPPQS